VVKIKNMANIMFGAARQLLNASVTSACDGMTKSGNACCFNSQAAFSNNMPLCTPYVSQTPTPFQSQISAPFQSPTASPFTPYRSTQSSFSNPSPYIYTHPSLK